MADAAQEICNPGDCNAFDQVWEGHFALHVMLLFIVVHGGQMPL